MAKPRSKSPARKKAKAKTRAVQKPKPKPAHPVDQYGLPVGMGDAFEIYFALGVNRSLEEVEQHTGVALELLHEWAAVHQWDAHVQTRLQEVNQAFAEQFHTQTQKVRTDMLSMLTDSLEQFQHDLGGVPLPITSLGDLESAARAYERLNRANAIALEAAKQIAPGGGDSPQTWADLLQSVEPGDQGSKK